MTIEEIRRIQEQMTNLGPLQDAVSRAMLKYEKLAEQAQRTLGPSIQAALSKFSEVAEKERRLHEQLMASVKTTFEKAQVSMPEMARPADLEAFAKLATEARVHRQMNRGLRIVTRIVTREPRRRPQRKIGF